jgi:Holliday junction resolvasome RuvABC endonuclease subunit
LSLDIFKEIFINEQQKELLANLSKKEKYLSKLCKEYKKEFVAIELQILSINSQSTNITKVA